MYEFQLKKSKWLLNALDQVEPNSQNMLFALYWIKRNAKSSFGWNVRADIQKNEKLDALLKRDGGFEDMMFALTADDISVLEQVYDAVMATEVVEHFHEPADGFQQMIALIKPAGVLAIMTNLQDDDAAFAHWYYRRDPTHVAFYRDETLAYIAHHYGLGIDRISRNVTFFTKLTDHH